MRKDEPTPPAPKPAPAPQAETLRVMTHINRRKNRNKRLPAWK